MLSPNELEIKELEKEYMNLVAKYETISEQIAGELNADNKETLEARRQPIKRSYTDVWNRLEKLKRKSDDHSRQYLTFKDDLPQIDFDDVMDEVNNLIQSFRKERGDALLLLQESLSMSGDLCLQRVRDEFKRKTGNFVYHELQFYYGASLNEYGWLEQLGRYLGFLDKTKPEDLANLVIEKICQSVISGTTVFLEIRNWDDLPCQEETLSWFVRYFWTPLVERLNDRVKYQRVKFIAAIVVEAELSPECFKPDCLCELEATAFRWLKLPLRQWEQDEIREWLESYPGIENPRSINLSQRFYRASLKGTPALVRQALEKEFVLATS